MLHTARPATPIARFAIGAMLAASALASTAVHATTTLIAQPAGGDGQYYSHIVTVDSPNEQLAFTFRNDPGYTMLADVSLSDGGGNLLTNGDFMGGTYVSNGITLPLGWYAIGQQGLSFPGSIGSSCGPNGMPCWSDGAVGGHDGFAQTISNLLPGNYTLSYYLSSYPQNNGGSVDTSIYFGSSLPTGFSPTSGGPAAPAPLAGTGILAALAAAIGLIATRGGGLVRGLRRFRQPGLA